MDIVTYPLIQLCCTCYSGAVNGAEGLLSVAGDSNLALRLSQLHNFFSCHLPSYREQWAIPDPPAAFQLIQVHTQTCYLLLLNKQNNPFWHHFARKVNQICITGPALTSRN